MSSYFTLFPKVIYDNQGNGNSKLVPDIFRRIKLKAKVADNVSLYDTYDVQDNEKPEDVSFKIYGSTDYYWVVCLVNDIKNRYYDWPLSNYAFEQFVTDKYANPGAVHHYEVVQSSGRQTGEGPEDYSHYIEVNSDASGAEAVTNYQYEQRLQNQKRQIRILNPAYLNAFVEEFRKLIRK